MKGMKKKGRKEFETNTFFSSSSSSSHRIQNARPAPQSQHMEGAHPFLGESGK